MHPGNGGGPRPGPGPLGIGHREGASQRAGGAGERRGRVVGRGAGTRTPGLSGARELCTLRPRSPRWPGGTEGLSSPEQDLPLEGPRRSPWEGLAPGAPHLHSPPSRPPPERGAEQLQGAVDPVVLSVSRPAPPGPLAADGRRRAGSCQEGRDGSQDTCEVGSCGSSSPTDLGSSQSNSSSARPLATLPTPSLTLGLLQLLICSPLSC